MGLKFGTAGVPLSAGDSSTGAGIRRCAQLGLEAMEVEFVHGVRMKEEKALQLAQSAAAENIALTCHAPYYINLNSKEREKVDASKLRIIQTARIAKALGASGVVFHPAFYSDDPQEAVLRKVIQELIEVQVELGREETGVILRPETTGKPSQFGSLQETIALAKEVPRVLPCIDFGHLHAREGLNNGYDEFCLILEEIAEALGQRWLDNAHCHISGIDYGAKGEKKHLVLREADLKYEELLKAMLSFGLSGTIICESPNMEEDTLILQNAYRQLKEYR